MQERARSTKTGVEVLWRDRAGPRLSPQTSCGPQQGSTEYWTQGKYRLYEAPIRLASRREADYLAAEARCTTEMLALINERRAANGQPGYTGPTDATAVLTELMEQRGRDFYLEAKRLGDLRRSPVPLRIVPEPGTQYRKPGHAPIADETCWPLPTSETSNNPNFG